MSMLILDEWPQSSAEMNEAIEGNVEEKILDEEKSRAIIAKLVELGYITPKKE